MAVKSNPFQYVPRILEIPKFDDEGRSHMEERDRMLEDYLGSLGGGITDSISVSLSSAAAMSTGDNIPYDSVDWANNATTAVVGTGVAIQLNVAGKWHISTHTKWTATAIAGAGHVCRGSVYLRRLAVDTLVAQGSEVPGIGHFGGEQFGLDVALDVIAQVGDLYYVQVYCAAVPIQAESPATLQAFRWS